MPFFLQDLSKSPKTMKKLLPKRKPERKPSDEEFALRKSESGVVAGGTWGAFLHRPPVCTSQAATLCCELGLLLPALGVPASSQAWTASPDTDRRLWSRAGLHHALPGAAHTPVLTRRLWHSLSPFPVSSGCLPFVSPPACWDKTRQGLCNCVCEREGERRISLCVCT